MARSWWWAALGLMVAESATAAEYYLESGAVGDAEAVAELARVAETEGWANRVVRRYRAGIGWQYVLLVEGFTEKVVAEASATKLADRAGQPVAIFEIDGTEARIVDTRNPGAVEVALEPAGQPALDAEVAKILERSVIAHGGLGGGLVALEHAEGVKFEFIRHVPDGPTVRHIYARHGEDRFLETQIESGKGVGSKLWIRGGKAWLATGTDAPVLQDATRGQRVIEDFSPERILAFSLSFTMNVAGRSEFQELVLGEKTTIERREFLTLVFEGGEGELPFRLIIDSEQYWLRKVILGHDVGELSFEFDRWSSKQGVVYPNTVKTWQSGKVIDDIEVLSLEVTPKLPSDWFGAPSP